MSQELFTLIMGLVALFLFGSVVFVVYRGITQDRDIGNQFVRGLIKQHSFALIVITFVSVLGETIVLSSFEPEGSNMHFIARVLAHIVVASFSWILLTQFPYQLLKALELIPFTIKQDKWKKHWAALKASKLTNAQLLLIFITPSIYLFVGVVLPFMNLYLLALGLKAELQLELFMYEWLWPFKSMSANEYFQTIPIEQLKWTTIDTVGKITLPANYVPFKDMPFELIMMMGTVFVAELGAMFKGLNYITEAPFENKLLDKGRKTVEKKEKAAKMDDDEQHLTKLTTEILNHFGMDEDKYHDRRDANVEYVVDTIVKHESESVKTRFSNTLARIHKNMPKKDDEDKMKTWKADVRKLWQSSLPDGKGFSRPLPKI